MRENRREGVGRKVRKWGVLFFPVLLSSLRPLLLAFFLVVVVSSCVSFVLSSPSRFCVSFSSCRASRLSSHLLACRLTGLVCFRSVVRPVVRPSFLSSLFFVSSARRLSLFFLRLVPASRCLLVGGGAIDAMWHGMGRPWLRVMMGMGARPSVVLVLLACSRLPMPAGIRSSRPPRLRLLACRG